MRKRFALPGGGQAGECPPKPCSGPRRPGIKPPAGSSLEENQGLIWSIVRRYARGNVELDDLYQLGCLGFLKAVQGFDLAFGTQFSTYAVPKIAGEIRRFLRDDSMVKIGRGRKERGYLHPKGPCVTVGRAGAGARPVGAVPGHRPDSGGNCRGRLSHRPGRVAPGGDGGGRAVFRGRAGQ